MAPKVNAPVLWNLDARQIIDGSKPLEAISQRQNIWRPWSQWKTKPPLWDSLLKEGAIVMATGSRVFQSEPEPIPELYLDTGGQTATYLPTHPLFETLNEMVRHNIIPVIDIGPPPLALCAQPLKPTAAGFDFHNLSIQDSSHFEKYHQFLVEFFKHLKNDSLYTKSFNKWRFQLHREPDNPQAYDPLGTGIPCHEGNLKAYLQLYDWSLSAMRKAGLSQILDIGNMAVPIDGMGECKEAWNPKIVKWLAANSPTECPHLSLPRVRYGDTIGIGFTAYANSQMGPNPKDFIALSRKHIEALKTTALNLPIRLTVGEGNIYHWPVTHRGDASPQGAAWNAAIFKICHDMGISRFQQWGFFSADNISIWRTNKSLPSATYHVVAMDQTMSGGQRISSNFEWPKPLEKSMHLDGIAIRNGLKYQAMIFSFSETKGDTTSHRIIMNWEHLPPNARIRTQHLRVDAEHGSYINTLSKWIDIKSLPGDPYDGLLTFQLDSNQKSIFNKHWSELNLASQNLDCKCEISIPAQANMDGNYQRRFNLPNNSVSWIELEIVP